MRFPKTPRFKTPQFKTPRFKTPRFKATLPSQEQWKALFSKKPQFTTNLPSQEQLKELFSNFVLSPKVKHEKLENQFQQIKSQLPTPVFWLFGKAQSGKTSLIRALTGNSQAEIGDGIRPCTRTAYLYNFPNEDNCFLKFLDTRGLGEVNYNPTEDMTLFKKQAHLLIVVMKALDHAQQSVMEPLRAIVKEHPHWPVIVVQTALHEGYADPETAHASPYPYHSPPFPSSVPPNLARSLAKQRELFQGIPAYFVPVDFTLPEDGYDPMYYGLDLLWETIEFVLPLGLRNIVQNVEGARKNFKDIYLKAAHPHIISYSIAAGSAGLVPVPFVSIPLTTIINAKMFQTIASLYNQEMNSRRIAEVGGAIGVSLLSNLGQRELVKFVPVYGTALASLSASAATYALGKTLCSYFSHVLDGDLPDKDVFQQLYAEQLEEGRNLFKTYLNTLRHNVAGDDQG